MHDTTFWIQCLLFLPLFLVINLVAAVPAAVVLVNPAIGGV